MEEKIAILIADLSGYTALTETHGPVTAADMIDTFLKIVKDSLVGSCKLHQRVGDEVMIISSSADELVCAAILLLQNCSKEHHFLQLHGGLHIGTLLKRNDHYFGSPLNLTSRIATKANKGTFWCSRDFISELTTRYEYTFSAKGKHAFKNVAEEIEVFELMVQNMHCYIDPVCRMVIHKKENAVPHPFEKNIFFCSDDCLYIYTNSISK